MSAERADDAVRSRALALDRALRLRASDRIEPFGWGSALYSDALPRVFELNVLIVEGPCHDLDAATLDAEAERLQGDGMLRHRRAFVDDEALGARLQTGMIALGWQARPIGLMIHRSPLDTAHDAVRVREVSLEALQEVHERFLRMQSYGSDPDTVRQLLEADAVMSRACGGRHFAGYHGERAACFLSLYTDGEAAQIQALATLPDARRRGLAGEVIRVGVRTAVAAGRAPIAIAADEEVPWLRAIYERMGFAFVGRWWAFTRLPA